MRFTTYERFEESPLRVIKKSGDRVRFDRERIHHGILRACEKLPVAPPTSRMPSSASRPASQGLSTTARSRARSSAPS